MSDRPTTCPLCNERHDDAEGHPVCHECFRRWHDEPHQASLVSGMEKELDKLRKLIADNCDPMDATEEDSNTIRACHETCYPENYHQP